MNRTRTTLGVALAGAGLIALGQPATSSAANSAARRDTFDLVANASRTSLLAIPCADCIEFSQPQGAHIGGTQYDAGTISRHGMKVGHYALVSIGVTPFHGPSQVGELELNVTLVVKGSQLVGQGLEEPPLDGGVLAITGGTGKYAGARGTIRYTDRPDGSTALHVVLER